MAGRKGGLGKGLDGLFPIYNTEEIKEKNPGKEDVSYEKTSAPGKKRTVAAGKMKSVPSKEKENMDRETGIPSAQEEAAQENGVVTVRLSKVEPNRDQPRQTFDEESLNELAQSISQYGILQPLVVQKKDDRYEIVAGERRWRAARLAGLKEVPVVIMDLTDREILEISLVENIQREDLNAIEEAKAYQRLMESFSLTQDEAAKRVSKSRTAVTNSLRLLKLDPKVQQMIIDETLSAGHARALLSLSDPADQVKAAQMVIDSSLSVRETEKLVKNFDKIQKPKPVHKEDTALDLIYREMEEQMKASLGTKVRLTSQGDKKGRIEIEYYSRDELERIYELLRSVH